MKLIIVLKTCRHIAVVIFILSATIASGQTPEEINNELELGMERYKNNSFEQALLHFEKVYPIISEIDEADGLTIFLCYLCQTCENKLGNFQNAIHYGEKALTFRTLSVDDKAQILCQMLHSYDKLSLEKECVSTINKLNDLFVSYKHPDIIINIVLYYYLHKSYKEVVEFEKDLAFFDLKMLQMESEKWNVTTVIGINSLYKTMADSFSELKDYKKSLLYYLKALDTLTPINQEDRWAIYASISVVYDKLGDKESALKYQQMWLDGD